MGTVVVSLVNVTPQGRAVPTAAWIRDHLFRALPSRGFPVVGGGPRIVRQVRPSAAVRSAAAAGGPVVDTLLRLAAPVPLFGGPALVALEARIAGQTVGAVELGDQVTTVTALVDTDPTTDAAKAKRELAQDFAREFPASQGWTSIHVDDYAPNLHGPRSFWESGAAGQTATRDHAQTLAQYIAAPEENPTGPNPPTTTQQLAQRAAELRTAAAQLGAGIGSGLTDVASGLVKTALVVAGVLVGGVLLVELGPPAYRALHGRARRNPSRRRRRARRGRMA